MADVRITKDTLTKGLAQFDGDLMDIVFNVFQYWRTRAVSDMRTNAKWTDQTGNARNGLNATIYDTENYIDLVLYHQVPYGIFLEVRWSGRYAIIGPTLNEIAPKLASMIGQALLQNGGGQNL